MIPKNIHPSWNSFLTTEIINELKQIESNIGNDFTPKKENILRFLTTNLDKMSVCIVGQDVYFQKGVSTGRAFEVATLINWDDSFKQVSLKNIIRLIHKSYTNVNSYDDIKKYREILVEIKEKKFNILPPKLWFTNLEQQGVLLLNAYLTCKIDCPNSHREIWQKFSIKMFEYIVSKKPDMIWFLWGKEAIAKKMYINKGIIYESRHPMLCSNKYEDDFLKSTCFKDTMNLINWLGIVD